MDAHEDTRKAVSKTSCHGASTSRQASPHRARRSAYDPQAWMADVLARMPDITVTRLPELLPWNWKAQQEAVKAA